MVKFPTVSWSIASSPAAGKFIWLLCSRLAAVAHAWAKELSASGVGGRATCHVGGASKASWAVRQTTRFLTTHFSYIKLLIFLFLFKNKLNSFIGLNINICIF
jgi:hypothetical protein